MEDEYARLIYVWIDSYKCLTNTGFCLVDDIDISYDKHKHEIKITKKTNYPECFEPIRDMAAIVGENGSGKTTFIEVIKQAQATGWIDCGFVLYEVGGSLLTAFKTNSNATFVENEALRPNLADDSNFVFASYPATRRQQMGNLRFIHINGIKHLRESQNKGDRLTGTLNRLTELTPSYPSLKTILKNVKISYPLGIIDLEKLWQNAYAEYWEWYSGPIDKPATNTVINKVNRYKNSPPDFSNENDNTRAIIHLTLMTLRPMLHQLTGKSFHFDLLFMLDQLNSKQDKQQNLSDDYFEAIKPFIKPNHDKSTIKVSEDKDIILSVIKAVTELVDGNENALHNSSEDNSIEFNFDITNKKELLDFDDIASQLHYKSKSYKVLSYQWQGISSGQLTLIELFAKLKQEISIAKKYSKSILVTLDEPELTLHPEWQRQFIKELTKFFYYSESFKQINIQFVITSHSPFILSDILNSNVLYLGEKNNADGHFAANIHELLLDRFFMNKSIGEVAAQLVTDCYKFLIGEPSLKVKTIEEAVAIAEQVSDKVIKMELNRLIEQKQRKDWIKNLDDTKAKDQDRRAYLQQLIDNNQIDELLSLFEGGQ